MFYTTEPWTLNAFCHLHESFVGAVQEKGTIYFNIVPVFIKENCLLLSFFLKLSLYLIVTKLNY